MRLTLRTLLSYLDDTLEPSQAKAIGAKVAESEQARDLMERIKQVTRRRRLTTPPATGPGGIDANTIAEYLDNEVTSEKAAEVEQICLASEVHLAEVAACHQILTLVLGEPALVPPSAKQRMYALVKGPEAIHSRKPSKAAKPELDLSSEIELDQDETLRLGVPSIAGKSDYRNLWILLGGGILAACLLSVAVWQLVHTSTPTIGEPKGDTVAQVEPPKEGPKKPLVEPTVRISKDPLVKEPAGKKEPAKEIAPETTPKEIVPIQVVPVPISKELEEIPYQPAVLKQVPLGQYIPAGLKEPGILLQQKTDKGSGWARVTGKNLKVISARPLMSLPGSKSVVLLDTGIEILLWGNMPELTLDPLHHESRVVLYPNTALSADLALKRGRIIITNKKEGKDAVVRLRFDNPTTGEENHFDLVLQGPGAAIAIERASELDRDEKFFENPKDPDRNGPTALIVCYAFAKSANVRYGQVAYTIDERQPILQWQSRQGTLSPPEQPRLPFWIKGLPTPKGEAEQSARKNAVKARDLLVGVMDEGKLIDVALAELLQKVQETALREIASDKHMSLLTFTEWRHALQCYTAIDDISYLFGEFSAEPTLPIIRGMCMQDLHQWLGLNRDHDYQMLDMLRSNAYKYKKTESVKIMELFHKITEEEARRPATYQHLIEGLNNERLAIRALCHWHLFALVPAGQAIPYDPAAPRSDREAAVREWSRLIPVGQMPPTGTPKKKDKL